MNKAKRILVIDDDPLVHKVIRRAFGGSFEVLSIYDPREAMATAAVEEIDLIILDVCMPNLDGHSLASLFKEDVLTRDIPVLMLTGLSGGEAMLDGMAAGADTYMTKPFDVDELYDWGSRLITQGREESVRERT
ncbi:MAG: response regulator [Elusimicrobiota bacterium]